jgi:ornithine cyclodeaminase/alanine dehydrogenase-like protein (mu-crystallin family)
MPGYVDGVLAAKLVALFPEHQPSHQALIAVFDAENGTPLAVMDGTHITAVRTGASSAVATRALAREDANVLTVLGAGVQGRSHLDAVGRVRGFDEVRVASRTRASAEALAAEYRRRRRPRRSKRPLRGRRRCCCTQRRGAGVATGWLDTGTHFARSGVGAGAGKLDAETVHAACGR